MLLYWLLGALPNDTKLHLSVAVGCCLYSVLAFRELSVAALPAALLPDVATPEA